MIDYEEQHQSDQSDAERRREIRARQRAAAALERRRAAEAARRRRAEALRRRREEARRRAAARRAEAARQRRAEALRRRREEARRRAAARRAEAARQRRAEALRRRREEARRRAAEKRAAARRAEAARQRRAEALRRRREEARRRAAEKRAAARRAEAARQRRAEALRRRREEARRRAASRRDERRDSVDYEGTHESQQSDAQARQEAAARRRQGRQQSQRHLSTAATLASEAADDMESAQPRGGSIDQAAAAERAAQLAESRRAATSQRRLAAAAEIASQSAQAREMEATPTTGGPDPYAASDRAAELAHRRHNVGPLPVSDTRDAERVAAPATQSAAEQASEINQLIERNVEEYKAGGGAAGVAATVAEDFQSGVRYVPDKIGGIEIPEPISDFARDAGERGLENPYQSDFSRRTAQALANLPEGEPATVDQLFINPAVQGTPIPEVFAGTGVAVVKGVDFAFDAIPDRRIDDWSDYSWGEIQAEYDRQLNPDIGAGDLVWEFGTMLPIVKPVGIGSTALKAGRALRAGNAARAGQAAGRARLRGGFTENEWVDAPAYAFSGDWRNVAYTAGDAADVPFPKRFPRFRGGGSSQTQTPQPNQPTIQQWPPPPPPQGGGRVISLPQNYFTSSASSTSPLGGQGRLITLPQNYFGGGGGVAVLSDVDSLRPTGMSDSGIVTPLNPADASAYYGSIDGQLAVQPQADVAYAQRESGIVVPIRPTIDADADAATDSSVDFWGDTYAATGTDAGIIVPIRPSIDVETPTEIEQEREIETPAEIEQEREIETPAEIEQEREIETPAEIEQEREIETPAEIEQEREIETPAEIEQEREIETPAEIEQEREIETPPVTYEQYIETIAEIDKPVEVETPLEIEQEREIETPLEIEQEREIETPIEIEKIVEIEQTTVLDPPPIRKNAPVFAETPVEIEQEREIESPIETEIEIGIEQEREQEQEQEREKERKIDIDLPSISADTRDMEDGDTYPSAVQWQVDDKLFEMNLATGDVTKRQALGSTDAAPHETLVVMRGALTPNPPRFIDLPGEIDAYISQEGKSLVRLEMPAESITADAMMMSGARSAQPRRQPRARNYGRNFSTAKPKRAPKRRSAAFKAMMR